MMCEKVHSLLDPVLDNELPTKTVASIMEHLNACPECQDDWDCLMALREHFQEFAKNIPIPTNGVARLDRRIRQEDGINRTRLLSPARIAAALAVLVGTGLIIAQLKPSEKVHLPTTVSILASNYRASDLQATPAQPDAQLKEMSKYLEFQVNVLQIRGWRLVSADVLHLPKTACIAQLTYVGTVDGKEQKLVCYQSCNGMMRPDGLHAHRLDGRLVCCGQIDGMSLVYWPGDSNDHLLVSTIPEKELMALALGVQT